MGNHAKSKPQLLTGGVKCGWRVGIGWPLLREAAASPSMVVLPAQSKSRTLADHRERREASTALRGMSGAALASVSAGGACIWWYHGMLFGIRGFVGGQLWKTQGHGFVLWTRRPNMVWILDTLVRRKLRVSSKMHRTIFVNTR